MREGRTLHTHWVRSAREDRDKTGAEQWGRSRSGGVIRGGKRVCLSSSFLSLRSADSGRCRLSLDGFMIFPTAFPLPQSAALYLSDCVCSYVAT